MLFSSFPNVFYSIRPVLISVEMISQKRVQRFTGVVSHEPCTSEKKKN